MDLAWESRNDKQICTLYYEKLSPSTVTMLKSPVAKEEINYWYWGFKAFNKKIMDFDYYEEYLTSINIDIILLCQYLEKQIEKMT